MFHRKSFLTNPTSDREFQSGPEKRALFDSHTGSEIQLPSVLDRHPLLHFFWLIGGYNVLLILGFMIFTETFFPIVISSILSGIICITLILSRLFEILFFKGRTDEGEPATLLHWIKYSYKTLFISTSIWLVAFFGHRLLNHLFLDL
jgi:hypothetical protein